MLTYLREGRTRSFSTQELNAAADELCRLNWSIQLKRSVYRRPNRRSIVPIVTDHKAYLGTSTCTQANYQQAGDHAKPPASRVVQLAESKPAPGPMPPPIRLEDTDSKC